MCMDRLASEEDRSEELENQLRTVTTLQEEIESLRKHVRARTAFATLRETSSTAAKNLAEARYQAMLRSENAAEIEIHRLAAEMDVLAKKMDQMASERDHLEHANASLAWHLGLQAKQIERLARINTQMRRAMRRSFQESHAS